MKQNKLILFDWGNIVESHYNGYGTSHAFNDLFRSLGYNGDLDIFKSLGKYHLSLISTIEELEKTYNEIKKDFNLVGDFNSFLVNYEKYFSKISYYRDVVSFEHSLHDACYIGILSNLIFLDKDRLDKQVNLKMYDFAFLSFEMKMRKPNRDIYEKVMEITKFKPTDILFIDDSENNIKMGKELGWNTLLSTGKELDKIKKACDEFLNKQGVK